MEGNDFLPRPSTALADAASESQSSDLATARSDNVVVSGDAEVGVPSSVAVMVNPAAGSSIGVSSEKRKRGRPPKGQTATVVVKSPPPKKIKEEEEEDVCFICFDGGSLVLCDRKWCPKAYHPACIKRDEAFFQSKAKWNCGWHICSVCQKAAHYTCYTCTYSLCKGCTKDADYVCVRGTNGFCITCMRTIMLIENKDHANKEMVQVDFDDITSWEYLFKVYWVCLRDKLSLTLEELTQAKNPWKGVASYNKKQLTQPQHVVNDHVTKLVSNSPHEHLELKKPKELVSSECVSSEKPCHDKIITEKKSTENNNDVSLAGTVEWASKELLEFVAHMKNGDASIVSQFDVQALLLEYIKKNNLRDPNKKSQIICDLRLKNLFQKPRVGHIEMLKLLEYHFLIIEDSKKNAFIPAGIVGALASHFSSDENNEDSQMGNKNKKSNKRKKVEDRGSQNNLDEYAAIDVHNINLIYMRRSLMETLIGDDKLQDKVVGLIVRIRILSNDLKQDMYRLVQVVGTSKVAVPYKIGEKSVDIMLEVLNLDKKECVAVDAISNQEFSEDECRRLRQSIRCGLVKRLTVGEIQKKAMYLQALRLNDRLGAEIVKLAHLRDLASEKGRKKELRECVEKLQLLKSPEERERRLCEICEVHTDPKMNPDYVSEEEDEEEKAQGPNDNKQDEYNGQKYSPFSRSIISRSISSKRKAHPVKEESLPVKSNQKKEASVSNGQSGSPSSSNSSENEKLWHYRDPSGNIQGPFSMVQLRKWSTTGFFPPDMRTWINNERDDSVLLTDALSGQFDAAAHLLYNLSLPRQEVGPAPFDNNNNRIYSSENDVSQHSSSSRVELVESVKTDVVGPTSSDCITSVVKDSDRIEAAPKPNVVPKDVAALPHKVQEHGHGSTSCDSEHIQAAPAPANVEQKDLDLAITHQVQVQGHGSDSCGSDNIQAAPAPAPSNVVAHPNQLQDHESKSCSSAPIQTAQVTVVEQKDEAYPHQGRGHKSNTSRSDPIQSAVPSNVVEQKDVAFPHQGQRQGRKSKTSRSDPIKAAPSNVVEQKDVTAASPHQGRKSNTSHFDHNQAVPFNVVEQKVVTASSPQGQGHKSNTSHFDPIQAALFNVVEQKVLAASPPQGQGRKSNTSRSDHIQVVSSNVNVKQNDVALLYQEQGHGSNISIQVAPSNVEEKDLAFSHQGHGSNSSGIQGAPSNVVEEKDTCQVSSYQKTDEKSESDGMSNVCESSGQNRRSCPRNINLNEMDTNSGFSPVRKSDSSELKGDIDVHHLASPTPGSSYIESEKLQPICLDIIPPIQPSDIPGILGLALKPIDQDQGPGCRQFLPPKYEAQDSVRSWTAPTNIEVGGPQIPDLASEWGGYSPTPIKPHAEPWSAGLISMSTIKQPEPVAPHPAPNPSTWHGVMEPIEFTTLAEESMSDLLAEVDAMESQNGLPSPTSALRCGDDIMKGCKDDYFGSLEDFSPTRDHGKTDALNSTGITNNEPVGLFLADAYNPLKRSNGQSSTSSEVEIKSRIMNRDTTNTTMSLSTGMEGLDTSWGRVPVNVNLDWGASAQGVMNIGRDPNQGMGWGNQNVNRGQFGGVWDEQRIFSGERYPDPRAANQGVDYGRGRPFWNRGGAGGGVGVGVSGGGGGYSRTPPKGQRVCKFYESGNCKRGASCGYLHP